MKRLELIKLLSEIEDDCEVYCVCDHGQSPEEVFQVTNSIISNVDNEIVEVHEDDLDSYEPEALTKVIMIN